MDMIGKINPPSSKDHQYILTIMDYFTKWVEAIPMKTDIEGCYQLSYPVPRKRERSLHTCAQDVQITRMATI
jgi:hypothetical protein